MATREERGNQLVQRLGEAGLVLVEWDVIHLVRLGIPLAHNESRVYLVPDADLAFVRATAAELDMFPMSNAQIKSECEPPDAALRYLIDERDPAKPTAQGARHLKLLEFMPLSWTGIRLDETMPVDKFTFEPRTPRDCTPPATPEFVRTVSIGSTCAALIRIMAKLSRDSNLHQELLNELTGIVAYCLCDMSYEGMYMDIPGNDVPLSDKEKQEIETAVADIQAWPFREDETWMRDFMVQAVRGEKEYDELPALEDAATSSV